MQHSVRSISLASEPPGRGLPRPERVGTSRRSSRHTADDAPGHSRRVRPASSGGYFTVEDPPPPEAPEGIAEVTGWALASAMWRDHLPEQLLGVDCASCGQQWPCDAWQIADGIITECCEAARAAAAKSRS